MIDIKQLVKEAFEFASEEERNSEKALNIFATKKDGVVTVDFDVDGEDYGIHGDNYVVFKNGRVIARLCEMLEGGGLEEIIEDELKDVVVDDIDLNCFKTYKEQVIDIILDGIEPNYHGHVVGYEAVADKIVNLFRP